MKAVFVKEGGGVEVREVPAPRIQDGEVLVRMRACGIDGTDLEKAFGRPLTPPMLGHEVVGVVEESRSPDYVEGERVFVHHHVSCGKCYHCLNNSLTMCPLFLKSTIEPCGLAELFRVPRINVERGAVLKLPDGLEWLEAVFVEPAACVLRALRRSFFKPGQSVSMVGVGPTGCLFIEVLKKMGASSLVVAELSSLRLDYARMLGADLAVNPLETDFVKACLDRTEGRGVDLGVLATPAVKPLSMVVDSVRRGGVVCLFGAPEKGEKTVVNFSQLFIDEKSIITSYSTTEAETTTILQLLSQGRLSFSRTITHSFRLGEAEKAFETARDPSRSLKVVVTS
ncbi:MAG: zinc-binding dehydrogenase [Candidatus Caldarchaeum sp.]